MDASYLAYPKRGYGQDHDLYPWRLSRERPRLKWESGAKVAVCFVVPLEFFPLDPSGVPFKHPGAMATPYPDLRHYTVRDYGNRVGVFRILEALGEARATFAVNAEVARRYPPLMEAIRGHEVAAHGVSTDRIHHEGVGEAEERELIAEALDVLGGSEGWMSPARAQSSQTLRLLGEAGVRYCLDWEPDQVPVATSEDVTLVPTQHELSDFTLMHVRRQSVGAWERQVRDAIALLLGEHERFGGQMLGLTLTPYVMGQPFRIQALHELMAHIRDTDGVEVFTAGEINRQFRGQFREQTT